MKRLFKPVPLFVCLVLASFWLYYLYFLGKNLLHSPGSMGRGLSPWYNTNNLISALIVFVITYSLSFMKISARTKLSSSRPMGTSEYLWYRMGQLSSNNFVMVARLEGKLDEEDLMKALKSVVKSQPMLRSGAKRKGNNVRLVEYSSALVQINTCKRQSDKFWEGKAEEEMNKEITVDANVLWRFTWIKGEEKHELLMTFNHMIADGRSGLNFYEMLFDELAGKSCELPVLPLFSAYENHMKSTDNIFSSPIKFVKAAKEYISAKKLEWNKIPETASGDSFSSLITKNLSTKLTTRLVEECRSNQTSVSSLLAASMLNLVDGERNTALSLAADMRPYLRELKGKEIGYFVTSIDLVKKEGFSGDKWSLASDVKTLIDSQLNKSQFLFDQLIRFLAFKTAKTHDAFRQLIKKALSNSMLLTNIGRVEMKTDYGSFKLNSCFHVPAVHLMNLPFFCLATSTLNGEMTLSFTYNSGCIKRSEADALVEKFMESLESL